MSLSFLYLMFGVEFSVISSIFSSSYRKFLHCILPHLPVSVPLCVVHLCVFTTPCGYFSHLLFYFEVICLYCVMFNFTYPSCLMVFDYLYLSLVVLLPFNSLITFLCINTVVFPSVFVSAPVPFGSGFLFDAFGI